MVKGKGFIILTAVMAVLFFLVPAVGLIASESIEDEPIEYTYNVTDVFVCDKLGGMPVILEPFTAGTGYVDLKFTYVSTTEEARTLSKDKNTSLILVLETDEFGRVFNLVTPENTSLTDGDTYAFADFLSNVSASVMIMKSELTAEQLSELTRITEVVMPGEDGDEALIMEIIEMIAPMLYAFLLYFMLIFYSQGVATSIVSEKHSKLMDTLLISTSPTELIFGKMLAVSLAGISQLSIWLIALVGGFATGISSVKAMDPETDNAAIMIFEMLSEAGSLFTPIGIILSVLFVVFGFLLYCSLSAIGGAISEKPEDLSANNIIFTGIMAVSFLVTVFSSPLYTGKEMSPVLNYVPFTSIMTVPTQLLLGSVSLWQATLSLGIVIVTAAGIGVLAGKLYKTFALYKGKFPGIKKALQILKSDKR